MESSVSDIIDPSRQAHARRVEPRSDPPLFRQSLLPNLDSFTPVSVNDYVVDMGRGGSHISFTVVGGQYGCGFLDAVVGAGRNPGLGCRGDIPAAPEGIPTGGTPTTCLTKQVGADGDLSKAYTFSAIYTPGCADYRSLYKNVAGGNPVLPAGHKISKGTVTCAALDDASVACLDTTNGSHGFLLSPSGSSAF